MINLELNGSRAKKECLEMERVNKLHAAYLKELQWTTIESPFDIENLIAKHSRKE